MTVRIRSYAPEDDPALVELERLNHQGGAHPYYLERENFAARAQQFAHHHLWVAEDDEQIVGYAALALKSVRVGNHLHTAGLLFDTGVHPDFRKQGIATQLAEMRDAYARERGTRILYGMVNATDHDDLAFFQLRDAEIMRGMNIYTLIPQPGRHHGDVTQLPHAEHQPWVDQHYVGADLFVPGLYAALDPERVAIYYLSVNDSWAAVSVIEMGSIYREVPLSREEDRLQYEDWMLFDLLVTGLGGPACLEQLIGHISAVAHETGIDRLVAPIDAAPGPVHDVLSQTMFNYRSRHVMVNALGNPLPPLLRAYIDPRDH